MTFPEFLLYLMQHNGVQAVFGFLMSFVFEGWNWLDNLPSKAKRIVVLAIHLAIPLLAAVTSMAAKYQPWSFEATVWPALTAGFLAFVGSQVAHIRKL